MIPIKTIVSDRPDAMNNQAIVSALAAPRVLPLRLPADVPLLGVTIPRWTPMDAEWRQRTASYFWSPDYVAPLDIHMRSALRLRDRLIGFAGDMACVAYRDLDLEDILAHGQLWCGAVVDNARMRRGRPCDCHNNVRKLWANANPRDVDGVRRRASARLRFIATGYALSSDGMWRQHSWLIERSERTLRLIETTAPRIAYYGFAMTERRADSFCDEDNWGG